MNNINYVEGDLIKLAKQNMFDVIAHGCNCFCLQKAGIAKQMAEHFYTDDFKLFPSESEFYSGNINKLGTIQAQPLQIIDGEAYAGASGSRILYVVNAYTQFKPGPNADPYAITLCFKKMNHIYKGKHIGLPKIGCGIGGLKWENVEYFIRTQLTDCKVTVVNYKP